MPDQQVSAFDAAVADRVGAGEAVEGIALRRGLQQPMLVGLSVHGDEWVDEGRERRRGHGDATGVGTRPAFGGDLPGDEETAVLDIAAQLLDHGAQLGAGGLEVDQALDAGRLRTGAHGTGVGPSTEQEAERRDDHGLARSGLTGDHGQARRYVEHRLLDHPKRGDPQLLKHCRLRCHGCAGVRLPHASP